jgi:hypothetical protein
MACFDPALTCEAKHVFTNLVGLPGRMIDPSHGSVHIEQQNIKKSEHDQNGIGICGSSAQAVQDTACITSHGLSGGRF